MASSSGHALDSKQMNNCMMTWILPVNIIRIQTIYVIILALMPKYVGLIWVSVVVILTTGKCKCRWWWWVQRRIHDNEDWALWDESYHDFNMIPFCSLFSYKPPQNWRNSFFSTWILYAFLLLQICLNSCWNEQIYKYKKKKNVQHEPAVCKTSKWLMNR
jgi:hypothetical protein